jgi:hypothetical protein
MLILSDWSSFGAFSAASDGDLSKLLEGLDLSSIKATISGIVRSLGFGPEADMIATVLIGVFVVLVVIGYAAGPKGGAAGAAGGTSASTDTDLPGKPHKGDKPDAKA